MRPDGTPIPSPALASADASEAAASAVEAPKPPVKPAPKATTDAAAAAQPSTPRLDLPTKLSGKSSARVAVAKTDTTAPSSIAEAANEPLQLGPTQKPEKAAKASKTQVASAEPATPSAPPLTADAAAATKSTGWAVQLAAPRSEAEAKSEMTRLNAKYASALNGSSIGVHKAVDKRRDDLSFARRRPVESRRGRVVRASEGRRRRVLHSQVGEAPIRSEDGDAMPKAFICGCSGLGARAGRAALSARKRALGPHPLQAQRRRPRPASGADRIVSRVRRPDGRPGSHRPGRGEGPAHGATALASVPSGCCN